MTVDGLQVFEDLFASLPDAVTLCVAVRDSSGRAIDMRVLRLNQSARAGLVDSDTALGSLCSELWPQMVVNGSFAACMRVLDTGSSESGAFWWTEHQTYRSVGYDYKAARVGTELLLWVLRDNTETVQRVRHDEARFQAAFDGAPAGMAMVTGSGQVVLANVSLASMLRADSDRLVGTALAAWMVPEDRRLVSSALSAMGIGGTITRDVEVRLMGDGSGPVWARMTISRLTVEDDWSNCFIVHLLDVTVQKSLEIELSHHAMHDPLTNLANRALLTDRLQSALTRLSRHRTAVGVAFVEVGPPTDDAVLVEVARLLERLTVPGDTVARFGNDQFVLVRDDLDDPSEAHSLSTQITDAFRHPLTVGDRSVSLSVGVGIATTTDQHAGAHDLIRHAEIAMHRADVQHFHPTT